MARQFIYHMEGLSKTYPGNRKVLEDIHLSFYPDAKIGVLGVNGSGKSTLLRIMAGLDKEYNGEAWVAEGARVGYLEQEPHLDEAKTVRENVMEGVAKQKAILDRYNELAMNYSEETADEMTKLQDEIEAAGLWDLDSKVDQAMDALRCPADDADVTKLSGGERRRVALASLLAAERDVLLLDEPTNHLDIEAIDWLVHHLRDRAENRHCAVVVVSHDRWLLDHVCDRTWEVDRGQVHSAEGGYSAYVLAQAERERSEEVAERRRRNLARKELAWLQRGARARTTKAKFRVEAANALIAAEPPPRDTVELTRLATARLGKTVIDLEDVKVLAGDRPLLNRVTWRLGPGDRVGIVGVNGSGKTSLLRVLDGEAAGGPGCTRTGRSSGARPSGWLTCPRNSPSSTRTSGSARRWKRSGCGSRWATASCQRGSCSNGSASPRNGSGPASATCPAASGAGSRCSGCS